MHINRCSKCGQEFETKNPKRIVCPNCLYLDRAASPSIAPPPAPAARPMGGPPPGGRPMGPPGGPRPGFGGGRPPFNQGGRGPGGPGGYAQHGPPQRGRPFGPPGGRPMAGRGGPPRRPMPNRGAKKLLIPPEVLAEIEKLYRPMLPLPNPDVHIKIGETLQIEPKKAFFGINLIRQKMNLPKLDFPKRPLAVTEDQLMAVKTLYEPYLPVPPIGIHKIISKQLKVEEWRVHVAIGLIRKNMSLERWIEDREDLPSHMKEALADLKAKQKEETAEKVEAGKEE